MTRLSRLALAHPSITVLLILVLFVGGILAARTLNQELIPDVEFPQATVLTVYPGASAGDMTESVTRPIEDALDQIDDVDVIEVSSNTSESVSTVTLRGEYGTTQDEIRQAVNDQLATVQLPDGAEEPELLLFDFDDLPTVSLSVSGDIDAAELKRLVDTEVVPELEALDGVADVSVSGARADKLFVTLDPDKLSRYGLSLGTIRGVLQANNLSIPAGTLVTPGQSIPLQVSNRITSEEALRRLVLVPASAMAAAQGGSSGAATGNAPPATGQAETAPATSSARSSAPAPEPDVQLSPFWVAFGYQYPADITPDIMQYALTRVPDAVDELTPGQLLALTPETARILPEERLAAQTPEVREALEDLRSPESAESALPEVPEGAVTLGDVATVELAPEDATTISRTDGESALGVSVFKEGDSNTVTVVDDVLEAVDDLETVDALDDVTFNTVFEQGSFIEESLSGVFNEGILGAVFAILVIFVFLSFSLRATLVTAISIPLSVVFAFLLMRAQGLTINILTLSGLTIAIGRIVDDAIVVTENIFRHLQRGDQRLQSVLEGTREVTTAITASTLVTVAVFLPLGFIGGITREFFLPFGLTATYALIASLLVAVTIVPVLANYFMSRGRGGEEHDTLIQRLYTPALQWALHHRWLTLVLSFAFFVLSLGALRFIPQTFMPEFGEQTLTVNMALAPGTDLATTDALARQVETYLAADEDIDTVQATVGSSAGGRFTGSAGGDTAKASFVGTFDTPEDESFFDRFSDEAIDPDEVAERVRDDLPGVAAGTPATFTVSAGSFSSLGMGDFDLQIRSDDETALREANALVMNALKDPDNWDRFVEDDEGDEDEDDEGFFDRLFGDDDDEDDDEDKDDEDNGDDADNGDDEDNGIPIINLGSNLTAARDVLGVDVDPGKALERGLTTAQVAILMREVIEGQSLGETSLAGDGGTVEVIARYPAGLISSTDALADFQLPAPSGPVRLGDIATVTRRPGPVQISRIDGKRAALITGEIIEDDTFGVIAEAERIVDDLELDDEFGEDVVEAGAGVESSSQQEGFRDIGIALLVSIIIVYAILVLTFRSVVHPFTILFSLPFAFSGALLALAISRRPLSLAGMIGLLMLVGIVVTNAVVLIDLVQQYRKRGMSAYDALVQGGRTRVRPIVMTAIATVLALTPQALELSGKGAIIASDLATTVIGGLLTSTFLTLIVVPVVYSLLDVVSRRGHSFGPDDEPVPPLDVPPSGTTPSEVTTG